MSQEPPPLMCPCGKALSMDYLKDNLSPEAVKSLWASYGSRQRTDRRITPELQAKMQVSRTLKRLEKWVAEQPFTRLMTHSPSTLVSLSATVKAGAWKKETILCPEEPTKDLASLFARRARAAMEELETYEKSLLP